MTVDSRRVERERESRIQVKSSERILINDNHDEDDTTNKIPLGLPNKPYHIVLIFLDF